MSLCRSILIGLIAITLVVGVRAEPGGNGNGNDGRNRREKRNPRSGDGTYDITISGFYKGQGTATVSRTSVTITAQVKSQGGSAVTFQTESLSISGQYFSGQGTVGDKKVTIKGRLDAAKVSRLVANFNNETGNQRGRIAGTLPNDPKADDKWDDRGGGGGPAPNPDSGDGNRGK